MSLSARIALDPSRRLERLAMLLPAGGVVVAAATGALRWPQASPFLLLLIVGACAAIFATVRRRRPTRVTLTVSQHADLDVQPGPAGTDAAWRLAESTVVWTGFSMLALRTSDPTLHARTVRLPVFAAEMAAADRRALSRFLVWSMHGGAGRDRRSLRP